MIFPWSEWAARSLRDDHGLPAHKVQVIPPGIDLDRWAPVSRQRSADEVVRLLFVGGDFGRKGGALLLDVFTQRLQGRCELHLVTRDDVAPRPGVYVYRHFGPNDPGLRDLYARCDIFVLPTQADCFSLASMEAMATGLPVVTTAVGGIPEIVADGRSGYLIAPGDGAALAERLEALVVAPERRGAMGREGRRIVEARFDAARNTARTLDVIVALCRRREATA
jgi:glycosyltransferase involved in cell wall biosynthesis